MEAHGAETPVGAEYMEGSGKAPSTLDRQEREGITGHDEAADRQSNHNQQQRRVDGSLKHTDRGPLSAGQTAVPAPVQGVVSQKQQEHGDSQPFMDRLTHQGIGHQQGKEDNHQAVQRGTPSFFHWPVFSPG